MTSAIVRETTLTPKGWLALGDVFNHLLRFFVADNNINLPVFALPNEHKYPGSSEGVYAGMWRLCGSASTVAVLSQDGLIREFGSDPLVAPHRLWDSQNRFINLVDGTIGSGSDETPIEYAELEGHPVLLPERSVQAFLRKNGIEPGNQGGRPSLQPEINAVYRRLYPNGHQGESWKSVHTKVLAEVGSGFAESTLKRAVKEKI